tara:strand:- start:278 stop:439 length:162 start_codon:yes stop_codon:yes gene_type:complete
MKYILLCLVLVSCTTSGAGKTFVMPLVETHPEERNVLMAVPVVPVDITDLINQ